MSDSFQLIGFQHFTQVLASIGLITLEGTFQLESSDADSVKEAEPGGSVIPALTS